jgi:hypothetical protein
MGRAIQSFDAIPIEVIYHGIPVGNDRGRAVIRSLTELRSSLSVVRE